ncbi:MAG: putative transposase [Paraglaciecola sp.]|jgi:putative transposase
MGCSNCADNSYSGHSYNHRRRWGEQRLLFLSSVFSIYECAYAVMSNHRHVGLHVEQVMAWLYSEEKLKGQVA